MDQYVLVKCLNTNTTKAVGKGSTLLQVMGEFEVKLNNPILGALVNNVLEDLTFELYHPKTILFIDITHPAGFRMYIRSLSFLMAKAVDEEFPNTTLKINHSISRGIYCEIDGLTEKPGAVEVNRIKKRMQTIIDEDLPFFFREEESDEVIRKYQEQGLNDKKLLVKYRGQNYSCYYELGRHVNYFYGSLVPSTGYLKVFDLTPYFNGILLRLPRKSQPSVVEEVIVQNKLLEIFYEHSQWNKILRITNLSELNESSVNGRSERLIKVSEALHEKKIAQIADAVVFGRKNVRIILISGPSSSGKTTFSKRLAIQMLVNGKKPLGISLDNYFVNRDQTPLDEDGKKDYEAIEALDVNLFQKNLADLLAGKKVDLPRYSFDTGTRSWDGESMKFEPDNILIIEGIHALNPLLTSMIPAEVKFRIYVSALTSLNMDHHNRISTTDNRLIRRIVRDYKYRNYSPAETISRWPSVMKGEEKHIFPFQEEADIMFNSALIYELAVLKPYVEPILHEVQPNQPEFCEATRLLQFFSYIRPMKSKEIPPTSILREFLGGSSFVY